MRHVNWFVGDLERSVLEALWSAGEALDVHDVGAALSNRPALAYTTVMTVLGRLHDKGLTRRVKHGRAFRYAARFGRDEFLARRALDMLSESGAPPGSGVLMAFLDSADSADPDLLDRLSSLIRERKRGQK